MGFAVAALLARFFLGRWHERSSRTGGFDHTVLPYVVDSRSSTPPGIELGKKEHHGDETADVSEDTVDARKFAKYTNGHNSLYLAHWGRLEQERRDPIWPVLARPPRQTVSGRPRRGHQRKKGPHKSGQITQRGGS